MPNSRSISWRYVVAPAIAARNASVAHRGRPHRLQLARRPGQHDDGRARRARRPAAPPGRARCPPARGSSRPAGRRACLRFAARTASSSRSGQRGAAARGSPRSAPRAPRRAPSRAPGTRPRPRAVRSSAVGPSPPLVTTRSTPRRPGSAAPPCMSSGGRPTTSVWARSTPSSRRRSDSHGPLRSVTRPVSTSVPVTTMPARALTWQVGRSPAGSVRRPARVIS